jgi:hypothetical protein
LLAIALTTSAPQFEVRALDGRTFLAPIVALDADQVTVQTTDGLVSLPIETLIGVRCKDASAPTVGRGNISVDLIDGSSLGIQQYTTGNGQARLTLGEGQVLELPNAAIAAVAFRKPSAEVAAEWSRIREMRIHSDLLVVGQGDIVDYHQGIVREVSDAIVQFELDGELLPVQRSKVHGLIYYHPPNSTLPEPVAQITDTSDSHWSAQSLRLDPSAGRLHWTTPGGATVSRELAAVTNIDFSRGKVLFLSDLKPESVTFTPYFGASQNVPSLAKLLAPRMDENLAAEPLQLGGKQYSKGLALHSRTEIVYRLPGRFRRLRAVVGIDDAVRPRGHLRLVIRGDQQVLLETTVTGDDPPKPIELDLTGVRRLSILADFGDNLDVADHLDLCEARIIK